MSENKVKDGNFLTIQSWMVKELGLKGNDLLVFSIIYMFSQDGESKYTGSLQYLADWCNSSKRGIQKNLETLISKGLICKEEVFVNGVKFVHYYVTEFYGVWNKVPGGIEQSSTNNKEYIKEDNKEIKEIEKKSFKYFENPELEKAFIDFVKMREKKKKPLNERSLKMAMNELYKHSTINGVLNEGLMLQVIEQSIYHCWDSFYELKEYRGKRIEFVAITDEEKKSMPKADLSEIDSELNKILKERN